MTVAQLISTDTRRALIGIGVTGRSVARYLQKAEKDFVVFDSRENPAGLQDFQAEFPLVEVRLGVEALQELSGFSEVILSPGIDPKESWVQKATESGARVIGDIELFSRTVKAPVIAITGSNAKSTVTTLVGEMAESANKKVAVGGNLGTAALDLIADDVELYVLELSSFQLELVDGLKPVAACILNLSADHMDRYGSMISYHAAKQRIYKQAEHLVYNRDDALTQPLLQKRQSSVNFGVGVPDIGQFGLKKIDDEIWLVKGAEKLIKAADVGLKGTHNLSNVLAAMALAEIVGIPFDAMITAAKSFTGLSHRSQLVSEKSGVFWINDSKATNVGAVKAALKGLGLANNIILIAGGQAKGQSFTELRPLVETFVKQIVLLGDDADQLADELKGTAPAVFAVTMDAAVQAAFQAADDGDIVLLSPACASFDMFSGYEQRGDIFAQAVESLI